VTHALHVPWQIVRELARLWDPPRGVHVVAVVHGAEGLTEERREELVEVLGVAPGGEGRVLAECALRHPLLRPYRALRIDDRERGESDAREKNDQRDAKAKRRRQREPAEERGEHAAIMDSVTGGDNGGTV
jgi:hypothetical protein